MRRHLENKTFSPELSVVVPVHNEEANILPLVSEIRNALDEVFDYELIYVDDGSDDKTLDRLKEAATGFNRMRILRHLEQTGQSTAICSGVKAAKARWIATLDGDGQNDPVDIAKIINSMGGIKGLDPSVVICGQRQKRQDSWIKRISSRIANRIRGRLLKDNTPDTGCGLKIFFREAFLELPYFDHMHRFLPALFIRSGKKIQTVQVKHRPRTTGSTHYGIHNRLWTGIVDLAGVIWLQKRAKHPIVLEEKIET